MFNYTIRPDDGGEDIRVTADSRDVLNWEKAGKGRSISKLLAEPSIGDAYILAYLAGKRTGVITCTPTEFEQRYLIVMTGEESPDPTPPAP
jgi:hypothetical protein